MIADAGASASPASRRPSALYEPPAVRVVFAVLAVVAAVVILHRVILPLWGPPSARVIWDTHDFSYPYLAFINRCYRHLQFPLWNPFVFAGTPMLGNLQTQLLNPLSAAFALIFELNVARLAQLVVAQIVYGSLGMFLWGYVRTRSIGAALIGAVAFAGCGTIVNFSSHLILLSLFCSLPLPFAAFEFWDQSRRFAWLVVAGGALTVWLVTSYPSQLAYYLVAFAIFYGSRRASWVGHPIAHYRQFSVEVAVLGVVPLLVASIHLIPAFRLLPLMTRGSGIAIEATYVGSAHPAQLASLLFAGLTSVASVFTTPDKTLRDFSVGVVPLFLAVIAMLRGVRSLGWVVAALVCIDLVLGAKSLLMPWLFKVSFFSRNSQYPLCEFGSLLSFVLLTLAVDGAADVLRARIEKWRPLAALALICIAWAAVPGLIEPFYLPAIGEPVLWNSVILTPAVPVAAAAAAVASLWLGRVARFAVLGALLIGTWADVTSNLSSNRRLMYGEAPPEYFADQARQYQAASKSYLSLEIKWPREPIYPKLYSFNMVFGRRSDWGFDSTVLRVQNQGLANPEVRRVLLDAAPAYLATRVLISENPAAVPLLQGDARVAAFPVSLDLPAGVAASSGSGDVRLHTYTVNAISYEITAGSPLIVVFNEWAVPGWKLLVDGHEAPILTANGFFRAAAFTSGHHVAVFRYRPPGFNLAVTLTAIGSIAACALAVVAFVSVVRRKSSGMRASRD